MYVLLNENYVEDDDNMFRFDYSADFLKWFDQKKMKISIIRLNFSISRALQPPGYLKLWHAGVRVAKNKKLVGFISASPAHIKVYEK